MLPDDVGPRDDLTGLERRLAAWRPSAGGLDRDRLLYEAGRAAARSEAGARLRLAMGSVAAAAIVAVGLGGWLAVERGRRQALELALSRPGGESHGQAVEPGRMPEPEPPVVRGPRLADAPAPEAAPPSPGSYLALTRHALADAAGPGSSGAATDAPGDGPRERTARPATLRVRGSEGRLDL